VQTRWRVARLPRACTAPIGYLSDRVDPLEHYLMQQLSIAIHTSFNIKPLIIENVNHGIFDATKT
jgi:hypothetical protein